MNNQLLRKVGSIGQDNLIAKLTPTAETLGVKIAKLKAGSEATTIERGTVLYADSDGKYSVFGSAEVETGKTDNSVPSAILADPVVVGADSDVTGVAYRSGNFNRKALITANDRELTNDDEDALRKYNIILTDMLDA